nr:SDR family oxidoreductase [Solirubrobacterales bacterium]
MYAAVNGVLAAPYAVSKAAVEALGRALRVELAQHGASATVAYFGFIDTVMVQQAIDADPLVDAFKDRLPLPLRKRLQPRSAGEAIVRGIEKRSPQVIQPRRWTAMSLLRGPFALLSDAAMIRDAKVQEIARGLDARGGEEQPLTATKR